MQVSILRLYELLKPRLGHQQAKSVIEQLLAEEKERTPDRIMKELPDLQKQMLDWKQDLKKGQSDPLVGLF